MNEIIERERGRHRGRDKLTYKPGDYEIHPQMARNVYGLEADG